MLIRAKDGNFYDIEFRPMSEEDWEILAEENENKRFYDFSESLEDYGVHHPIVDEEEEYEFHNYSIFVNDKLAGCVFGDDISDIAYIREYIAGVYIRKKYRGLGLNSIALDSLALMSSASRIYLIIHCDNIASVKSSKGYSLYSFQRPDEDFRFSNYTSESDVGNYYILYKDYQ